MNRFRRRRRNKAGQLLEFTLLLPMALVLMTFTIDMGRLVLASTSLHSATATGARAGARVGYSGTTPADSTCQSISGGDNPAYDAFCQAAQITGGARITSVEIINPLGDGICVAGSDLTQYVTMRATARLDFITPGLAALVGVNTGTGSDIEATGSARCEVTR